VRRRRRAPKRSVISAFVAALLPTAGLPGAYAQAMPDATAVAAAQEEERAQSRPKWQLAPIGWRGQLGLVASVSDYEGQPRRSQFTEVVTVDARSYIWQPWFIQVMGGAGLLLSQTHDADNSADPHAGGGRSGGTVGLTGNLAVNVFPVSRFPFQLMVDVADSRTSGDFVASDSRSTRIGLRQSYRTLRGDTSYTASLDNSTLTSDSFGRDRVTVLDGQMSTAWSNQRLVVNANFSDNARSSDDLGFRAARLSARHNWLPDELTTVENLASVNHEQRRIVAGGSSFITDVRQVSSLVNWRSDWDEPLIVFGSARLYEVETRGGDSSSTGRSGTLSGSASYRFTPNLSTFGSAALAYLESDAQRQTLSTEVLGVQYTIDPRTWGRAAYTANAGVSVANQTGGELGDRHLLQLQAGHQLSYAFGASRSSGWQFALGQSGGWSDDSDSGHSQTISHTASLSWRHSPPTGLTGFASLSVGDSRTRGGSSEGDFQLANLQVTGQFQPGPYSQLSANVTAQVSRQVTLKDPEVRITRSASGGISYQHARAFGVPRLRYTAQLNAYNQQTDRRLLGDPESPRERVSWVFEQRVEYQIGRLDCRLTTRLAEVDGKKNASLIASVYRRFGR
jgi:hypothetical protein